MRHHLTSLHESICDIVEFGTRTMTRTRPPKLDTLTPKQLLYVERSIIRCKG
jgi:hypothetical protein